VRTRRQRSVAEERRKARLIRAFLIEVMGHRCAICGKKRARWHLDHPYGRHWPCRGPSRLTRMKMYLRDWLVGNLRLLCHSCNERDGALKMWRKRRAHGPKSKN
jgi:hypothetical protein